MRDHPQPALGFERRIELIGAETCVGDVEVALLIEPGRVRQDDRAAVDLLEHRALAGVDLAEHLAAFGIEAADLGPEALRLRDHLPLGVDHRGRAGEREDRALREGLSGDRHDGHAERAGEAGDQLLLDHLQGAVLLHCKLADVAFLLGPAEGLAAIPDLRRVGDEHMRAILAEDGAFRVVELLHHLHHLDGDREGLDLPYLLLLSLLCLHRTRGADADGKGERAPDQFVVHGSLPCWVYFARLGYQPAVIWRILRHPR